MNRKFDEGPPPIDRPNLAPLVVGVLLLILAGLFIADNRQRGTVHLLLWDLHSRTWVTILFSMFLGVLLGGIGGYLIGRRK